MKKKNTAFTPPHERRGDGIFDPESGDVELDNQLVSSTGMTGAVPAARRDPYDEDAFEEYYF